MIGVTTATLGALDLLSTTYGLLQGYDLGTPALRADAAAWDAAGNQPLAYPGDRHEDVEFTMTFLIYGTSASDAEANLSALTAAFVPGAKLTVTEGSASASRYTYLRSFKGARIERHDGTRIKASFTGIRCPYWHGAEIQLTEGTLADNRGTHTLSPVPGDVTALTRFYVAGPSGTTGIVLAVRDSDTGFTNTSWIQDETGTGDASMVGAAKKLTTINATTYADISSTRTLATEAYAGRFLIAARVSGTAGDKVKAVVSGVASPVSVCAGGGVETVLVGPVNIPVGAYTRDFPSTTVKLQAKGTPGSFTLDAWWLVPVPSPTTTDAAVVHLDSSLCLDGIPLCAPNAYSWDRTSDTIGTSTLDKCTPWGWPMLRPGNNTLFVYFAAPTLGTGYIGGIYVPRYLTVA